VQRPAAALGTAVFFIVVPGVVAGLVPRLVSRGQLGDESSAWLPVRAVGVLVVAAGIAVLVLCFVRFVMEGLGTPAPAAPTERLVVGGAYRFVRNPMYVAIIAIILGQALLFLSLNVLCYAVLAWAAMAAFAHWYEEPTLARTYGAQFDSYRAAVPGWLPRIRPWTPEPAQSPAPTASPDAPASHPTVE
jgi:protein-S-isoprenylcysteine O-methyltransferase Ste14